MQFACQSVQHFEGFETSSRLITRWEYYPELFEGFVHLACLYTILKGF